MPKKANLTPFCQHILTWEIKAAVKRWKKASPLRRTTCGFSLLSDANSSLFLSPCFFKKRRWHTCKQKKKWTINLWESQKAKNYKHSKLALLARQQQLETQFQRKFREIIFTKNFAKIYPVNTRYMFELVRMMFVHVVRSFLKQRKRRRGEGEMRSFDEPHFFLNFLKPTLSSMHT